jgi:hypothetical protein
MTKKLTSWEADVSREIRRRIDLVSKLDSSERSRSIARQAIRDPVSGLETFVRDWAWTYDPRNKAPTPKELPLVLWDRQAEFLKWLQRVEDSGDDGVVDKSRDVGVSWLVVAFYVWRWLTVPGWAGAIGSRKADLLDRLNDPKSVFWKVEFSIRMLPDWMRPPGFEMRKHRSYSRIINPETNATITGEAGPEMGRGGRSSLYFLDEFGVMPRAAQVRAAVADNARSILYASTATAPNTEFFRIVHEDSIPHFRLSWKDDPRKDESWRDDYVRKYGLSITAREVDIDYSGGGDDLIIPSDWVRAAVDLDLGPESQSGPKVIGFDVADSGEDETVIVERLGPVVRSIEAWRGRNPVDSAAIVLDKARTSRVSVVRFDSIGVGAGVSGAFASHDSLPFRAVGVNVGVSPTSVSYSDAPERVARERFANLKAELWWSLRLRFWASWRYMQGEPVPVEECISIPNDAKLISQLSVPKIQANERGLLKIESKESLRRRGTSSPDRADALVLAFADVVSDLRSGIVVHGQTVTSSEKLAQTRKIVEGGNGRGRSQYERR